MIVPIEKDDLINCLNIFHQGYEAIAIEFGLTEENCPDRGRASLPYEKLLKDVYSDSYEPPARSFRTRLTKDKNQIHENCTAA